uniref:Reverse transcriptase domain-containing protein n=1 Tax=Arundo donax TaxID=35708 RepID=A0A0A9CCA9_ARUDO
MAYVDDIVVKSMFEKDHIADLAETFANLRKVGIKLNPAKCVFGVRAGKLLGYMVLKRGIDPNPEKIKAVMSMEAPKTMKDIQRFSGRLAAISQFIARSAEKSLPFYQALRGPSTFR